MPKSIRPLGDVMCDMEPFIQELMEDHDLQHGEFLNILRGYVEIHYPNSVEVYKDGSNPVFYYGPKEKHAQPTRSAPPARRSKRKGRG